jgi:hypothetical protein
LRLRFVTLPDKGPAAGYTLTARLLPTGQTRELGMTDRGGRIVLQPGFADGLLILRLLAGNLEPMVERTIIPGKSSEERVIAFKPLPQTVALEAQVDSLCDEVVDLVALRARLEARMKARLEGEDWAGLEEAIREFVRLTPGEHFSKRLDELTEQAAPKQALSKTAILTKTAHVQVSDLQAMIDRYLENDAFKAYSEALERGKSGALAKVKERAKAQAKRVAPPLQMESKVAQPVPAPKPPAPTQPQPKPAQPPPSTVPF